MTPRYPVYVISKGRADQWGKSKNRPTGRVLDKMGIPYRLVIEPQEHEDYARFISPEKILTLPFSNLNRGSIPARNWCWVDSVDRGHRRHWILDDNICHFRRLGDNKKQEAEAAIFSEMENFVDQFSNVALAGPDNVGFARADAKQFAYRLNRRIYSCILIQNSIPYRWRGIYNEDTDLALRCLKDGWVTVLFKKYLMDKKTTMRNVGGNREQLYAGDGRLKMAQSLARQHPDVARAGWRFGRPQHIVDYSSFKNNRLVERAAPMQSVAAQEAGAA